MNSPKEILVLGAGVSGLSTAIVLLKKGCAVTIWAKDLPPDTTSNKAAALWYPYLCLPKEKAAPWAKATFLAVEQDFLQDPASGCFKSTFTEMFATPQGEPWWKDAYPGVIERPKKEELPEGYVDGYRIESIIMDTTLYMEYLVKLFASLGGTLIQREISDIQEAFNQCSLIVNCTGLGSKTLFDDEELYPVRGQMVKVRVPGFDKSVIADDSTPSKLVVAVARTGDVVIGGTAQKGNWSTEVNPDDTKEIMKNIARVAPELTGAEIVSEYVGLRPGRSAVRLEAEKYGDKTVIHNYGHGGAGFTLSWGCAEDAAALAEEAIAERRLS